MKIKICGLRSQRDVDCVNACRPDYIGFVFAEKSRRYIAPADAAALRAGLRRDILPVGVFVNADIDVILDVIQRGAIECVQLHGDEDAAVIAALRARTDKKIIRAFQITGEADLQAAAASPADAILLDAGKGDGKVFDWSVLRDFHRPYFLAGGLSPANIEAAIDALHPYGADVSSGVETDGRKDAQKIKQFITVCRRKDC